jgi:YggT family protein
VPTIIYQLLYFVVDTFKWAIFLSAVISMLLAFNVLDSRNRIVWMIADFLFRVTDPALRPIRAILPSFGGIDLSPWVAMVLIQYVVEPLLYRIYLCVITGTLQPMMQ